MRIASFNIRGLKGRKKKSAVRDLVVKERVDFLCLQETKVNYVDERLACILWGSKDCGWVYSGSLGAAGGLCCVWDNSVFVRKELWGDKGLLGVLGLWEDCAVNIVNVYAPSKPEEKREMWKVLQEKVRGKESEKWCFCGDFNAVREEGERRGKSSGGRQKEMQEFNE